MAHYEMIARLGEGAMGDVYPATDAKLNREVALEVLPELFASDSQRTGNVEGNLE